MTVTAEPATRRGGIIELRFTDEQHSLEELAGLLGATQSFIQHAALADLSRGSAAGHLQDFSPDRLRDFIDGTVASVRVLRVQYASPLEVVLAGGAAIGLGFTIFNRMVDSFERFQRARATKADTDLYVDSVKMARQILQDDLPPALQVSHALRGVTSDAAVALASVEEMHSRSE